MLRSAEQVATTGLHEETFLARYDRLLGWALQLTEGDREQAEDLVHDAFIHFTFSRPDLAAIHNLDGYLYTVLRNIRLSQLRRRQRLAGRPLSDLEYDSAELQVHTDGVAGGARVLLVDDLLATGGTMQAGCGLIEKAGGRVAGCAFLVELTFLKGRELLTPHEVYSLIKY